MILKLRNLIVLVAAFAVMAPVCVLSGGETRQDSVSIDLAEGALVEVVAQNAEVRVRSVTTDTLELDITMHNEEFVDFYTQSLSGNPTDHFVISATTSTGGQTTANSLIELALPAGVELSVRTTNKPIVIDAASLSTANLSTENGKITVRNSSGEFDLTTTNSEVTVQAVDGPINVSTTNAHVWFEGVVDEGQNSISTTNGDVSVRLRNGSDVAVTGITHNGDVTVNGGDERVIKNGDKASVSYEAGDGTARLIITNGPGAIHINPDTIAVFDGDG